VNTNKDGEFDTCGGEPIDVSKNERPRGDGVSKSARIKSLALGEGKERKTFIKVQEGAFGYHAILEGGPGLWAASKISAADAVLICCTRHLMLDALEQAEDLGLLLRIDLRQVAPDLWLCESGVVEVPGSKAGRIRVESAGKEPLDYEVDPKAGRGPLARSIRKAARKVGKMVGVNRK
jgi:hypothetical protein